MFVCHYSGLRILLTTFALLASSITVVSSQTLTLLGQLDPDEEESKTDIWGYYDSSTQKEYAIMGYWIDLVIMDVTDPANPFEVATMPDVGGFDMKTYQHYLYTTWPGTQIVDLSDMNNLGVDATLTGYHNLTTSESGLLIGSGLDASIYDIDNDPLNPAYVTSVAGGHDVNVVGNMLYSFGGGSGTYIYDITDVTQPELVTTINDPAIAYSHHGAPTEDGNYLLICDELASSGVPDITVWDISVPDNPERVDEYHDPNSLVHNLYVIGNYAYVSFYAAGLRIFDISNPLEIELVAEYDTYPGSDNLSFVGAWGVYPFAPSGNIYVSDTFTGLYVFQFDGETSSTDDDGLRHPERFELAQNYPNPFNPSTTISLVLPVSSNINLVVFDISGRQVRQLVSGLMPSGTHEVIWDGNNNAGQPASSGVYFYQLRHISPGPLSKGGVRGNVQTRKMMLIR